MGCLIHNSLASTPLRDMRGNIPRHQHPTITVLDNLNTTNHLLSSDEVVGFCLCVVSLCGKRYPSHERDRVYLLSIYMLKL